MIAGHETTSTATTWCLFALTQALTVQTKLREELLRFQSHSPDVDELNALPYLDAVVREALRLHPPATMIQRTPIKDDVIPLERPVVDNAGREQQAIRYVLAHVNRRTFQ